MVARKITVIQMLPELEGGGVETVTLETAAALVRQGHRSLVISAGGAMVDRLERQGSRHLTWPHIGEKSPRCLKYILPLKKLLTAEQVDILHLRSRLPAWVGYMAWKLLPPGAPTRLVTTFHGFYSVNAYSRIMTRGERVIAISNAIARHLKSVYHLAESRIELIHEGIDLDLFSPETVRLERINSLKKSWGIDAPPGKPVIMLPARVTRLKGHDLFIRALAAIRHLDWQALCVGGWDRQSSYYGELTELIKNENLGGRIIFTGDCPDMPAAYSMADIVVSASRHPESFGRIAVEAQAMGKMVIATAHGGSLETVRAGESGLLVPPGQVKGLAEALAEALNRVPLKSHQVKEARAWVKDKFSLERMCRDTLDLYRRMAP